MKIICVCHYIVSPLSPGPLAAKFIQHKGCRCAMLLASVMMCTGYFVSAFASSFELVLLFYGVVLRELHLSSINNISSDLVKIALVFIKIIVSRTKLIIISSIQIILDIRKYGITKIILWNKYSPKDTTLCI